MTAIEWTDKVWNPTTGCDRVSPGCDHCYAMTMAKRLKGMGQAKYQKDGDPRTSGPGFGVAFHPDALEIPLRWRKPQRIFVNSMSDLFHESVPTAFIGAVFDVMAKCPQHTFQILTKRHARMRALSKTAAFGERWPLLNVWLGVSVEDQKWADIRIPALTETRAAVRFLSCEPLIGAVDLSAWMPPGKARWQCTGCRRFYSGPAQEICPDCGKEGYWCGSHTGNGRPNGQPISWVIAGGESGPGARPMHPAWPRMIRDQCARAEVPFLFKQWGAYRPGGDPDRPADWVTEDGQITRAGTPGATAMVRVGKHAAGRVLDGWTWDQYPDQPESLRVPA